MKFDFKNFPIITEKMVVIMQIKVVIAVHQRNGQTAHNAVMKRMKTKLGGMWQRHNHPFLPL